MRTTDLPAPIQNLYNNRPFLFESPDYWRSRLTHIEQAAQTVKHGQVRLIGQSEQKRPIHCFEYGTFEPQNPTTTISSALSSDRWASFFDPAKRTRPSLTILSCMHGGETEGIAICLNIIHILETGKNLQGKNCSSLQTLLGKMRLTIVPCMNPDGRQRALVDHLVGAELDDLYLIQQGIWSDGTLPKGRKIKETQPFPPDQVQYLGGYYNQRGINLQHDDFFGPALAPENRAVIDMLRHELPDGFLSLHAHGAPPCFYQPDAMTNPAVFRRQDQVASYALARLIDAGFGPLHPDQCSPPPWSFNFQTFAHQATGALPLLLEVPQGIHRCPFTHDRILDSGNAGIQAVAEFALHFGLRPTYGDPFPRVTPA